jgi:hypothetical protein
MFIGGSYCSIDLCCHIPAGACGPGNHFIIFKRRRTVPGSAKLPRRRGLAALTCRPTGQGNMNLRFILKHEKTEDETEDEDEGCRQGRAL